MHIRHHVNKHGMIWVNVASSTFVLEDFVNLDNSIFLYIGPIIKFFKRLIPSKYIQKYQEIIEAQRIAPLIKHDCRKKLPFADCAVDHILCSHFLEHVFPDEADIVLHDFYRVLKSGGTLDLRVPDLKILSICYLQESTAKADAADTFLKKMILSHEKHTSIRYRLLDLFGWSGYQHRWMYDAASLEAKAKKMGDFEVLSANNTPSRTFRENGDSQEVRICFVKKH
jgi:predicted SAM-dependent methyltransferase